MVNPDLDGYSKTPNHRKILRKMQNKNNLLKTKGILIPKYKVSGGTVFTFSLSGGRFASLPHRQLRHWLALIFSKLINAFCCGFLWEIRARNGKNTNSASPTG